MKRVVLLLLVVGSAAAAQAPRTIAPGMSRAEVIARLGAPLASRTLDGSTYLYYANGCERRCGMQDVVVLDSDKVVDAIFRSAARRYIGVSSSPEAIPAGAARQAGSARLQGAPLTLPAHTPPADSAARVGTPAPGAPGVDSQRPVRRQPSPTAPTRSEIRIPMMGTPTHAAPPAPADTVREPLQPARRQAD